MKKLTLTVILMMSLVALFALPAFAADAADAADDAHAFVGAKKCKTCHKAQFTSWSETGHATTWDRLSAEEQKDPKCTGCHMTGTTAKDVALTGVQCEACHGAGADYKSAKIMSKKKWKADPEGQKKLALAAGLIMPTEKDCVKCHTKEGNPNFKEFKFEESAKLVHPAPTK